MLKISDTMSDLYPDDMVNDLFGKDIADVTLSERTDAFQKFWEDWSDNSYTLPTDELSYTMHDTLNPHMKSLFEWQQKRVLVEVPIGSQLPSGSTSHWKYGKQIFMVTRCQLRFATPELLAIAKILLG